MEDQLGCFYFPDPADKQTRVYVRHSVTGDDIDFRLWRAEHPEVWDKHGWVPYEAIQAAAKMYKDMGRETDPLLFYDISVAKVLLKGK